MKKYIVTLMLAGAVAPFTAFATDTIHLGNSSADEDDNQFHSEMQQNFSNIFNSFFSRAFNDPNAPINNNKNFIPFRQLGTDLSGDVTETKDSVVYHIDMPGAKKESIKAEVTPRNLNVTYQQTEQSSKKDDKLAVDEARYASFQRVYSLPDSADYKEAEAEYKDGILYVTVPKLAESETKPKKLRIK